MNADSYFMQRCLWLAQKGRQSVHPNPMVGCVITVPDPSAQLGQRIIGEGFHQQYGCPHAEVHAVNAVENHELLQKATVYVSLEPCSHHGKTPPCADLLVKEKVKKVVVGMLDPNPQVAGNGIKKLQEAGIAVSWGIEETLCRALNAAFCTFHEEKRPYVVLKWAQTPRGFLFENAENPSWISNVYSRQLVHKWRSEIMAIMVGYNTALHDNPSLTTRDWAGASPYRIVIDQNVKLPQSLALFNQAAPTMVLNQKQQIIKGNTFYEKPAEWSLKGMLNSLYHHNINSVLVEGGQTLLQGLIDHNLWDEARIFTGIREFASGTKAPLPEGNIVEQHSINQDILRIIKPIKTQA